MTSLPLDDDIVKALEELAKSEGRSATDVARDALRAYVERQRYLAAIDAGRDDVAAGRVIAGDRVDAWLASWGSENELDPPT